MTTTVAEAIASDEPEWEYIGGVCSCPKLVDGQKFHDVGSWHRIVNGQRETITIDVYVVSSSQEAADWMARLSRGEHLRECALENFELGEEAHLLTCSPSHHYEVYYRTATIIASVGGDQRDEVEKFARYAFKVLP